MVTYRKEAVGAGYGLVEWLGQRVTATFLALYTLFMLGYVFIVSPKNYAEWSHMFSGGVIKLMTLMFILCLLYHAWVGMRDLWMDYIKPAGLRLVLQVLTVMAMLSQAVWAFTILYR
jgi:succinate dehydrogenase / fumarate reductase, membrane anchor subunit